MRLRRCVQGGAYRQVHARSPGRRPGDLRRARHAAARGDLRGGRPRDHRRLPASCEITEIGAVKVRGGQLLGEFQTLVNPGVPIPPFISVLTGISDTMVAGAPRLGTALPAFLEFAGATPCWSRTTRPSTSASSRRPARRPATSGPATECSTPPGWPARSSPATRRPTASSPASPGSSARRRPPTTARCPTRAPPSTCCTACSSGWATSASARSTSWRPSPRGSRPRSGASATSPRRCRTLPGVYLFVDERGEVLYVGKSKDLRTRVRTYFTAAETRGRMAEMVGLAAAVVPSCAPPRSRPRCASCA